MSNPHLDCLWRRGFYRRFCRLYGRGRRGRRDGRPDRRQRDGGRGQFILDLRLLDFLAAGLDQPLVGRHQRHVRIDEYPAVSGRDLQVEMQVIRGRPLALEEVAHLADHLALAHEAAAQHSIGVELPRQHVQIAHAKALAGRI